MSGLEGNAKIELFGDTLPQDVLVHKYVAEERLSQPYRVVAEFVTKDQGFDVAACLRRRLLLVVTDRQGKVRYFDGMVEVARFVRVVEDDFVFEVTLRPSLAVLQHRQDSRIFQAKSIPDVVKEIFAESGLAENAEWKISRAYLPREFTVQYQETTLNFVQRLLEEVGIFYFFQHDESGHKMILMDDATQIEPPVPEARLSLSPEIDKDCEPLVSFSFRRTLATTHVALRDFDFERPQLCPAAELDGQDALPGPYYEYPARFVKSAEGNDLVRVRLAEQRATARVCGGQSSALVLNCGHSFTVTGAEHGELDGDYVVTELRSAGSQIDHEGQQNFFCQNQFSGIPLGAAYAPPRLASRPRILGLQTAVVTGDNNADQAICTDKYGRIKVRFMWDRVGQKDATSSCWIRALQVPMGGSMVLPRLGWEVSVAFLEGDPDRPVILGRVYNAELTPPMALPAGKASGCLKSMSSPGSAGHNQISMGDSGGSQGHGIQAQKDLNIVIGNDCTEDIGVDDNHEVSVNMARSVGADETISVGVNQSITIGKNLSCKITGNQTVSVGVNDTSNATANYLEKIGGDRSYTVGAAQLNICNGIQTEVTGGFTRQVGAVQLAVVGGDMSDDVVKSTVSNVMLARVHLVAGTHGETVDGAKTEMVYGAALHKVTKDFDTKSDAMFTRIVGGVHMRKIGGDYSVSAPMIVLLGAVGMLKAGSSKVSLSGGPITLKGSKVSVKAGTIRRTGVSLKMA